MGQKDSVRQVLIGLGREGVHIYIFGRVLEHALVDLFLRGQTQSRIHLPFRKLSSRLESWHIAVEIVIHV